MRQEGTETQARGVPPGPGTSPVCWAPRYSPPGCPERLGRGPWPARCGEVCPHSCRPPGAAHTAPWRWGAGQPGGRFPELLPSPAGRPQEAGAHPSREAPLGPGRQEERQGGGGQRPAADGPPARPPEAGAGSLAGLSPRCLRAKPTQEPRAEGTHFLQRPGRGRPAVSGPTAPPRGAGGGKRHRRGWVAGGCRTRAAPGPAAPEPGGRIGLWDTLSGARHGSRPGEAADTWPACPPVPGR